MKKHYVRPTAVIETFSANEYVAACEKDPETGETLYNFTCDAGVKNVNYKVYIGEISDDNEITRKNGQDLYHPCGVTHTTKDPSSFPHGYIVFASNPKNITPVIIWRGEDGTKIHCATALTETSGVAPANFEPTRS